MKACSRQPISSESARRSMRLSDRPGRAIDCGDPACHRSATRRMEHSSRQSFATRCTVELAPAIRLGLEALVQPQVLLGMLPNGLLQHVVVQLRNFAGLDGAELG